MSVLDLARDSIAIEPDEKSPVSIARDSMQNGAAAFIARETEAANDSDGGSAEIRLSHAQTELFKKLAIPSVFNEMAAPPGVDFSFDQSSIANQIGNSYDELTIGQQGGGALYTEESDIYEEPADDLEDESGPRGKKKSKVGASLRDTVEEMNRMREESERAWDESMHRIGNMHFSGEELDEISETLSDERKMQEFEDNLVANEGLSREEAKARRQKLEEVNELIKKMKAGDITEEERRRLDRLSSDPQISENLKELRNQEKYGSVRGNSQEQSREKAEANGAFNLATAKNSNSGVSAEQRADIEKTLELLRKSKDGTLSAEESGKLLVASAGRDAPDAVGAKLETASYKGEYNRVATADTTPTLKVAAAAAQPVSSGNRVVQVGAMEM